MEVALQLAVGLVEVVEEASVVVLVKAVVLELEVVSAEGLGMALLLEEVTMEEVMVVLVAVLVLDGVSALDLGMALLLEEVVKEGAEALVNPVRGVGSAGEHMLEELAEVLQVMGDSEAVVAAASVASLDKEGARCWRCSRRRTRCLGRT